MFNPTNTAHISHLRTPAQGTSFYAACKASSAHGDTSYGITIPTYSSSVARKLSTPSAAPTTTLFGA